MVPPPNLGTGTGYPNPQPSPPSPPPSPPSQFPVVDDWEDDSEDDWEGNSEDDWEDGSEDELDAVEIDPNPVIVSEEEDDFLENQLVALPEHQDPPIYVTLNTDVDQPMPTVIADQNQMWWEATHFFKLQFVWPPGHGVIDERLMHFFTVGQFILQDAAFWQIDQHTFTCIQANPRPDQLLQDSIVFDPEFLLRIQRFWGNLDYQANQLHYQRMWDTSGSLTGHSINHYFERISHNEHLVHRLMVESLASVDILLNQWYTIEEFTDALYAQMQRVFQVHVGFLRGEVVLTGVVGLLDFGFSWVDHGELQPWIMRPLFSPRTFSPFESYEHRLLRGA